MSFLPQIYEEGYPEPGQAQPCWRPGLLELTSALADRRPVQERPSRSNSNGGNEKG
ncbi:hypothetical protein [Hymenobacter terrenus]|uniref:hypothetical protein n=1 Tax=Hymenobacter terrenus TaxID=1629124 RepID=UPI000AAE9D01|nr:hypothetical protein [Hymenobacter terrenus]